MLDAKKVAVKGGPSTDVLVGGSGPPLVWLHGMSGVVAGDALLEMLARRYSVYAPLMPGRIDLKDLDGIENVHDLALYYDQLLEILGLERVTLAGHGFGAMMAAEIAAHVPKRVAKLALIAPLGLWNDAYPVADIFARPYAGMDELMWQDSTIPATPNAAIETYTDPGERQIATVNAAGSVAKFVWAIPDRGLRRRLYRITAPTLVMFGEQDAYVPASYARDFAEGIAGVHTQLLKGSHMLPFERPQDVAEAIAAL